MNRGLQIRSGEHLVGWVWLLALAACGACSSGSKTGAGGADGSAGGGAGAGGASGSGFAGASGGAPGTGGAAGAGSDAAAGSSDAFEDAPGMADATDAAKGSPITATAGEWTWVPFPDSHCGDGSTVGIGINPNQPSSRLLIYLEGGGACWSELTCYTTQSAAYFTTGYSAATFASEAADQTYLARPGGLFDRTSSSNPFKDASYVYVPYCTGDLHAGDNVMQYGTNTGMHVGAKNIAAYLERLVPTFQGTDRVYLAGSSAGGFGALFNWWQVQQAFGGVRVDMIDDSGTPMPPDILAHGNGSDPAIRAAWNLAATLPPGCTACATRLDAIFGFYAQAFPNQRGTLLSYTQDSTLPAYYGITTAEFTTGLDEDISTYFVPNMNLKSFLVQASGHVLWFGSQQFQNLESFLELMTTDDATWASLAL